MVDENVNYVNDPNDPNNTVGNTVDDNVQHGIDDDPNNDAEKGAVIGGLGGAVTGAVAGAMTGPGGAVLGAVIGGVAGAVASGLGVAAVDRIDNDNTVSGIGQGQTPDYNNRPADNTYAGTTVNNPTNTTPVTTATPVDRATTTEEVTDTGVSDSMFDNLNEGSSVGGTLSTEPGFEDERGLAEERRMAGVAHDASVDERMGNNVPGIQTGGRDADGSPDTRGIMEKSADAITGDKIDDKTGKPVS